MMFRLRHVGVFASKLKIFSPQIGQVQKIKLREKQLEKYTDFGPKKG